MHRKKFTPEHRRARAAARVLGYSPVEITAMFDALAAATLKKKAAQTADGIKAWHPSQKGKP